MVATGSLTPPPTLWVLSFLFVRPILPLFFYFFFFAPWKELLCLRAPRPSSSREAPGACDACPSTFFSSSPHLLCHKSCLSLSFCFCIPPQSRSLLFLSGNLYPSLRFSIHPTCSCSFSTLHVSLQPMLPAAASCRSLAVPCSALSPAFYTSLSFYAHLARKTTQYLTQLISTY